MIQLTYEQKCKIGFQYILDCLNPSSPYGQDLVRKMVSYSKDQRAELELEWNNIEKLRNNRREIQQDVGHLRRTLMQMKDIRQGLKKVQEMCLNDLELFEVKNFLIYSEQAGEIWRDICEKTGVENIEYVDLTQALDLLDPDGRRIPTFSIYDSYSEKLSDIRRKKRDVEKKMQLIEEEEQLIVMKDRRHQLVLLEEEEEQNIREVLTKQLRKHVTWIYHNVEVTGHVDLLLEKTDAALFATAVRPVLTEDRLEFTGVTNPWVASVLREKNLEFTPLSIDLSIGTGVITGANMGGKSVSLSTITLNVLLALCGFFVYAEEAYIPFFDQIMILSEEMQSVDRGLSSFGAEIVQMQKIAQTVEKEFCFVVLDEFSRGTNPHEGAALVRAVTKYLNQKHVVALLVTHFDHVAEYATCHYQVVGLKDMNVDQVQLEIDMAGKEKGVDVIASHMNYGLYRVDDFADCPRDAFRICRLLGLQNEIMDLITEE